MKQTLKLIGPPLVYLAAIAIALLGILWLEGCLWNNGLAPVKAPRLSLGGQGAAPTGICDDATGGYRG